MNPKANNNSFLINNQSNAQQSIFKQNALHNNNKDHILTNQNAKNVYKDGEQQQQQHLQQLQEDLKESANSTFSQGFNKSMTASYKITPVPLRRHKMMKDRLNYHLNKSSDYDYNQKTNLPNIVASNLNQDFNIIYSDESILDMLPNTFNNDSQLDSPGDEQQNKTAHIQSNMNNKASRQNNNNINSNSRNLGQYVKNKTSPLKQKQLSQNNNNQEQQLQHQQVQNESGFVNGGTNLLNLQQRVIGRNQDILMKPSNQGAQNSLTMKPIQNPDDLQLHESAPTVNHNLTMNSVESIPPLRQVVMTAYQNTRYDATQQLQSQLQGQQLQPLDQKQEQRRQAQSQLENSRDTHNESLLSQLNQKLAENQSVMIGAGETTNAASQYQSSHHFVMSKSVEKTSGVSGGKLSNLKRKSQMREEVSNEYIQHPYDSTLEDQSVSKIESKKKQPQLSQATLNKLMQKNSRSTSRSFFTRRPKTVQQMLELNSNSTFHNQKPSFYGVANPNFDLINRKYSSNIVEQVEREENEAVQKTLQHNQTFDPNQMANGVLTNTLFKNNPQGATQFSNFKEANSQFNNHNESQSLLQKSFQSANKLQNQSQIQNGNFDKSSSVQQQQEKLNKKLLKKQVELLKQKLDTREYEFENKYGLNQEGEKVFTFDKKEMQKDLVIVYEEILRDYCSKMLKKEPQQRLLLDRCFQGLKTSYLKIQSLQEIDYHQKTIELLNFHKEFDLLKKEKEKLQQQLDSEQEYLRNMFEKTKQEGLSQMVREWEQMKSLSDQLGESVYFNSKSPLKRQNTNNLSSPGRGELGFNQDINELVNSEEGKKFLNEYSGAIIQLKDLYSLMRGNVFYDKQGDFNLDIKSDVVVDRIEFEMQEKFKNVQSRTAMKVLKRFYKKIEYKDQATCIDEDPLEIEKQRLERVIDHLRHERDNDMKRIMQLQVNIEQMQKSHNTVQVQYRETKSLLSQKTDECEQKEGEIKDLRAQFKYQNEQITKFSDQVKELMFKCDDYEQRMDMYKESLQYLETKHKKRKQKLTLIKQDKKTFDEKVQGYANQIEELQSQVKKFQKQTDPERKRIIMVKKPIFDAAGNQVGEGLVEQVVTMRTDESMGYLQSLQHSNVQRSEFGDDDRINEKDELNQDEESDDGDNNSDFSLDSQEMTQLQNLLKEQGLHEEVSVEHAELHKKRMSMWFKGSGKVSLELTDEQEKLKDALALQFKNQLRLSRKARRQEERAKKDSLATGMQEQRSSKQNSSRQGARKPSRNQNRDRTDDQSPQNQFLKPTANNKEPQSKAQVKNSQNKQKTSMKPAKSPKQDQQPTSPSRTKNSTKVETKNSLTKQQTNIPSAQQNQPQRSQTTTSIQKKKTFMGQQQTQKKQAQNKNQSSNQDDEDKNQNSNNQILEEEDDDNNDDNQISINIYEDENTQRMDNDELQQQQEMQNASAADQMQVYGLQDNNSRSNKSHIQSRNTLLNGKKDSTFGDNQDQNSVNGQGNTHTQQFESPREPRIQILHRSKDEFDQDFEVLEQSNDRLPENSQQNSQLIDKNEQNQNNRSKISLNQQTQNKQPNLLQKKLTISPERKLNQQLQRQGTLNTSIKKDNDDLFNIQRGGQNQDRSHSFYQNQNQISRPTNITHTQAYLNYNSKHIQTEITGDVIKKPNAQGLSGESMQTQTEDFMFPMDEELKQRVMTMIGGRLAKYGDSYDKGSSFFTKAAQIIDEIEDRFMIDVVDQNGGTLSRKEYQQLRLANGLQDPRYKQFKPVLKTLKTNNTNNNNNNNDKI